MDFSTAKGFRRRLKDRPRVPGSTCPRCDAKAKLVWAVLEGKVTVAGRTLVGPMTVESCPSCGTSLVEGGELRRVELEAARALLQAGTVSGTALRGARDAMRMTCEDLARELGVEPETVADWESGERPIARLAVSMVGAIVTDELARKVQMHERLPVAHEPAALGEIVR
jgi:DNA-binding transcriptional regulator YiaG